MCFEVATQGGEDGSPCVPLFLAPTQRLISIPPSMPRLRVTHLKVLGTSQDRLKIVFTEESPSDGMLDMYAYGVYIWGTLAEIRPEPLIEWKGGSSENGLVGGGQYLLALVNGPVSTFNVQR
ncbi:hypothetical protein BDM02DRAFT_2987092 [Thelephora ganbajun]|uniref:Uncharacterized protein n=1 Tax=Thelephora ganbajun TaxID=370292 RepID=A0ACB6ZAS4_THEGA|nr:hypothetical protein BDM02DRAFT_2987092 [Thelephora ganbajun]